MFLEVIVWVLTGTLAIGVAYVLWLAVKQIWDWAIGRENGAHDTSTKAYKGVDGVDEPFRDDWEHPQG